MESDLVSKDLFEEENEIVSSSAADGSPEVQRVRERGWEGERRVGRTFIML